MYVYSFGHMWGAQNYLYMIHQTKHTLQDVYLYIILIYTHQNDYRFFICVMCFFFGCPVFSPPKHSSGLGLCSLDVHWFNGIVSPGHAGRQVSCGVFRWECHGFFHQKKTRSPSGFFSQIGGNEKFNEHTLRW